MGGQGVWEQKRSVQSLHSCFFLKKLFLYRWLALQTLKAAFNLGKKSTIMQSMLGIKWMSHLGSLVLGHTTKMQAWDFCFCFFFQRWMNSLIILIFCTLLLNGRLDISKGHSQRGILRTFGLRTPCSFWKKILFKGVAWKVITWWTHSGTLTKNLHYHFIVFSLFPLN